MRRATRTGWLAPLTLLACIIPDREVQIVRDTQNLPVRVIERTPLPLAWDQWCNDPQRGEPDFCPRVRVSRPSGLIRPEGGGNFCVCPEVDGEPGRDLNAISSFSIFASDPDLLRDQARDTLYGVLLLDPDPFEANPTNTVAYRNYLAACGAGRVIDAEAFDEGLSAPLEERELTQYFEFRVKGLTSDVLDLCNDNLGAALPPGLHNLQFMVTDREFYRPTRPDGEDGGVLVGDQQCGVPDLGAGATFDVINFVFECIDSAAEDAECNCEEG